MSVDWWQLGWVVAGFFLLLFFAQIIATHGLAKKAEAIGEETGWHNRQHWETDAVVKGKLERP